MSQENVEILRQTNEAFNRGDIEGFLSFCKDDVQVEDLHNAPDMPPIMTGKAELRRVFAAWSDAFDNFTGEIEEYIDVDDRHVACVVHYRGTERDTGLEVDFRGVDLWEFKDDQLFRGTLGYRDRHEALEAVGLSEQDAHAES